MPDEPNPIYNGRTCAYCDAEDVQAQCRACHDGLCRHAKLRHRTWDFRVTNPTGFVGPAFSNDISFSAVHGCCDLLTSTQCQLAYPNSEPGDACPTRVIRSSFYKWRRYSRTYSSVFEYWRYCTNPSTGDCVRIGPVDLCAMTIETAKACVLGWVLVTEINRVRLFITRTKPRYNCTPDRCQFRLALVIEGNIGLSWATQVTEGGLTTVNSSQLVCGESPFIRCEGGPYNWPIGSPPAFNVSAVPVTLHPWRQVLRRTVDHLDFPMVFNPSNSVSATCGPKCAAAIVGGTFPTFGEPPPFVCDAPIFEDCINCFGESVSEDLCTPGTCETCPSAAYPFRNDFGGQRQTLISSTDSGEQTGGYLPDTTYPTEWTVELW